MNIEQVFFIKEIWGSKLSDESSGVIDKLFELQKKKKNWKI